MKKILLTFFLSSLLVPLHSSDKKKEKQSSTIIDLTPYEFTIENKQDIDTEHIDAVRFILGMGGTIITYPRRAFLEGYGKSLLEDIKKLLPNGLMVRRKIEENKFMRITMTKEHLNNSNALQVIETFVHFGQS